MKGRWCGLASIVLAFALSGCAATPGAVVGDVPPRPELLPKAAVTFNPRKPERWVLANGLVVYYLFDDELPVMKGKLMVPGGSLFETADQAGLFEAVGEQLREGSVKGISPEVLDKTLDDLLSLIHI